MERYKVLYTSGEKLKPMVGSVVKVRLRNNKVELSNRVAGVIHLSAKEVKKLEQCYMNDQKFVDILLIRSTSSVHYLQKVKSS